MNQIIFSFLFLAFAIWLSFLTIYSLHRGPKGKRGLIGMTGASNTGSNTGSTSSKQTRLINYLGGDASPFSSNSMWIFDDNNPSSVPIPVDFNPPKNTTVFFLRYAKIMDHDGFIDNVRVFCSPTSSISLVTPTVIRVAVWISSFCTEQWQQTTLAATHTIVSDDFTTPFCFNNMMDKVDVFAGDKVVVSVALDAGGAVTSVANSNGLTVSFSHNYNKL